MYPIANLDIGGCAKRILQLRGIRLCEQVCQYTQKDLVSYGFSKEMITTLNTELRTLGYDGPLIRKKATTRNKVDWEKPLIMPEGVKLFGGDFKGNCIPEDDEQKQAFNWWKINNPGMEQLFIHINNETVSNVQGYMKMLAKGMLKRAPDNLIIYPANGHIGFACELKRLDIRKSLSNADRRQHFEEQKEILAKWAGMGMYSCVACGASNFILAWNDYISKNNID
ncbi:hypothetical protein VPHD81_0071 [Vibrio phage D81]